MDRYRRRAGDRVEGPAEGTLAALRASVGQRRLEDPDVVFAGYGITAPELSYDEYAGLDVAGKIVLVMSGEPRERDPESPFRRPEAYRYTEVRYKVLNAREHGAAGVLLGCLQYGFPPLAALFVIAASREPMDLLGVRPLRWPSILVGRWMGAVLAFGLCGGAAAGLPAPGVPLTIPRVHDCIPLLLGSPEAHAQLRDEEKGTFFVSGGWLEGERTVFTEYRRVRERYGEQKARRVMATMFDAYRRLVFIHTGHPREEEHLATARELAQLLDLSFAERDGGSVWLERLVNGPWEGDDFITIQPGKTETQGNNAGIIGSIRQLSLDDADALRHLPYVENVNPSVMGNAELKANGKTRRTTVFGEASDSLYQITSRSAAMP